MDKDLIPEGTIMLEPDYLDFAIVGIDQTGKLVYDYDLLVDAFMFNEPFSLDDAVEWIDYNIASTDMVTILYKL